MPETCIYGIRISTRQRRKGEPSIATWALRREISEKAALSRSRSLSSVSVRSFIYEARMRVAELASNTNVLTAEMVSVASMSSW